MSSSLKKILGAMVPTMFLCVGPLCAQYLSPSEKMLLLPQEVMLSGTVIDASGSPIASVSIRNGAGIDSSGNWKTIWITDGQGRFNFNTKSPFVVFTKRGFRSIRVPSKPNSRLRITLLAAPVRYPACSPKSSCDSLGEKLCIPKLNEFTTSEPVYDIDYVMQWYRTTTPNGPLAVRHGMGPNWTPGNPNNEDVWRATEYEEIVYGDVFPFLTDAHGRSPDGKYWRYIGNPEESLDYRGVDAADANKLDALLDGICLWKDSRFER